MSNHLGTVEFLADVIAYANPVVLGVVYAARKIDTDQPRHPELTRVVGLLLLSALLFVPVVSDAIGRFVHDRWNLAAFDVLVVRFVVLLAASEYVALAGRLASRRILVDVGRPYAAITILALLSAYWFTPVRIDGRSNAAVFNGVFGIAAVIASGMVLAAVLWARRRAMSPAIRRSTTALKWASLLGMMYGALTGIFGDRAIVGVVAGCSLAALALAGALAFIRRQRVRQLDD